MTATKWHYYVRHGELSQDALNEIGKEGWELVSVETHQSEPSFYFKRAHPPLTETVTIERRERFFDTSSIRSDQTT